MCSETDIGIKYSDNDVVRIQNRASQPTCLYVDSVSPVGHWVASPGFQTPSVYPSYRAVGAMMGQRSAFWNQSSLLVKIPSFTWMCPDFLVCSVCSFWAVGFFFFFLIFSFVVSFDLAPDWKFDVSKTQWRSLMEYHYVTCWLKCRGLLLQFHLSSFSGSDLPKIFSRCVLTMLAHLISLCSWCLSLDTLN